MYLKKILFLFTSAFVLISNIFSAVNENSYFRTIAPDSVIEIKINYNEITAGYEADINALLSNWYQSNNTFSYDTAINLNQTPVDNTPDSVYIARLKKLSQFSGVELPFNEIVKSYINMYLRRESSVRIMAGLKSIYFPIFEAELDKQNLPQELKYMTIIESALNPRAYSHAGASGLWQFMYATGKMYGLEQNNYYDERNDPAKSTKAAVRYLKDLYNIYNDWHLAIASYNCGPGTMNRAISRAGGVRDYWAVYNFLPKETRGYVPVYIAATYIMNYYQEHNIKPLQPILPLATDTVEVRETIHLAQVSEVLNIPIQVVRDLNPMYRTDIIPGSTDMPFTLKLPIEKSFTYIDSAAVILQHRRAELIVERRNTVGPYTAVAKSGAIANASSITHIVRAGDNVGSIAKKYHVGLSDLKQWNNIKSNNRINSGQKLIVYVPATKVGLYKKEQELAEKKENDDEVKRIKEKLIASADSIAKANELKSELIANKENVVAPTEDKIEFINHTVKRGDTIYGIARLYPGVEAMDIIRLNGIAANQPLTIGQQLRIMPKKS